jgi:hypothetical protein
MIDKKRHWAINPKVTDQHGSDTASRSDRRAKQ